MDPRLLGAIVFSAILGAFLLGMYLRGKRPEEHFAADSKDAVKLGAGFIGTMTALVLGLMVASAKSSYDTQKAATKDLFGSALLVDRLLAHYGPDAAPARAQLKEVVASLRDRLWTHPNHAAVPIANVGEQLYDTIFTLKPTTDAQRAELSQAQALMHQIAKARLLLFEEANDQPVPTAFMVMVTVWIAALFLVFGMLSPRNTTVAAVLLMCALAAAGALYLVLEMERPFDGIIQISERPALAALEHIGR